MDAHDAFNFFARRRTDIDEHLIHRHDLGALRCRQKMRGTRCHHAGNFRALACKNFHPLRQQRVLPPSAHGDKLQEAIRRDVLHEKADLVHVACHHHPRTRTHFTKNRTRGIDRQFTVGLEFINENRPHLVLMTGHGMCLREFLQQ